jgi:ABC-type branched-subunit amino acid transport system substrate-binding protein
MTYSRALALLLAALLCVVGLTACGGDDNGSGSAASTSSSGSTTSGGQLDSSKGDVRFSLVILKIPGSDLLTPYGKGAEAAAKQINAQGGFGGRQVVIDQCNTQGQPATTSTCAHQGVTKKPVAFFGCELTWANAGMPIAQKAGIPSVMCLNTPGDFTDATSFGITPGGPGEMRGAAKWICQQSDIKSVGVILLDLPSFHKDYPAAVGPTLQGCGKKITGYSYVSLTNPDVTPYVNKITATKPDFIMAFPQSGSPTVQIFKALQAQGFPADRTWAPSSSFNLETSLKPAGDAMNGTISSFETSNPEDPSNPGVTEFAAAMEAAGLPTTDPNIQQGYLYIRSFYEIAEKIGFDKFDSQSLSDFLSSNNGFQLPLSRTIVNPGPSGKPQEKQPYIQLVQWKDGKLTTVKENTEDGWINGF